MPSRPILGGPNILGTSSSNNGTFFQRIYINIPSHEFVGITLMLWYFDQSKWINNGPGVSFSIDGTTFQGEKINTYSDFTSNADGNYDNDLGFVHIKAGRAHQGPTLTFKVINLSQQGFFGIRNVTFHFSNYSGSIDSCHMSEEFKPLKNNECECDLNQYLDVSSSHCQSCRNECDFCFGGEDIQCLRCSDESAWNGERCSNCHPSCWTCTGPEINQCSLCPAGFYKYENNTCANTCQAPLVKNDNDMTCSRPCLNKYQWSTFTCRDTCEPPLITITDDENIEWCVNPCGSNPSSHLYPSGDCITPCEFPLNSTTVPGLKTCTSPNPRGYINDDDTNSDECESPLLNSTLYGINYCKSPCTTTYIFKNGSCTNQCSSPLQIETINGYLFCVNPCENTGITPVPYLYQNGECDSSCNDYFREEIDVNIRYCIHPCSTITDFYYPQDDSCDSECKYPLKTRYEPRIKYCENPCQIETEQSYYLYPDQSCSMECLHPLELRLTQIADYCESPCAYITNSSDYYYADGSCGACPEPLNPVTILGIKYCNNPCESNEFVYPNKSCNTVCAPPLTSKTINGIQICESHCSTANNFLYANQTCMNQCPLPLKISNDYGINFCNNPCSNNTYFLYVNGSCFPHCDIPLLQIIDPGVKYCKNPCNSQDFLYTNGSCIDKCPPPLKERTDDANKYCENPCEFPSEFTYTNGSCISECLLPLESKFDPMIKYCSNPCQNPDYFLYTNGSCFEDCPVPLKTRYYLDVKYCENPCSQSNFLNMDGSCSLTCLPPFDYRIESGVKYCFTPCSSTEDFVYSNGSCKTECPYPLSSSYQFGFNYCYNPCSFPSEFLYFNKTCETQCPSPLVRKDDSGVKYCNNPCEYGEIQEFLYFNNSCQDTCPSPLISKFDPEVSYCLHPCSSANYFLYSNGSCADNCNSPMKIIIQEGVKTCVLPCPSSNDFLYPNGTCSQACESPLITTLRNEVNLCLNPCDETKEFLYQDSTCSSSCSYPYTKKVESIGKFCLGNPEEFNMNTAENNKPIFIMAKLNKYIPYVGMPLPPRLDDLANSQGVNVIALPGQIRMSKSMLEAFPKHPIPYNFERRGLHSSFLVNFWDELMYLTIATFCGTLLFVFEKVSEKKGWNDARNVFMNLRVLARNNWVLILMAMYVDEIILYASLEFRTLQINSFWTFLSFISSLTMFVGVFTYLGAIYYIVMKGRNILKTQPRVKYNEYVKKWEGYQSLFGGLKEEKITTHLFYLGYVSRSVIITLCSSYLYDAPVANATFQMLFSIFTMSYILYIRPIKKRTTFIQLIINESIFLLTNICMLALAADIKNKDGEVTSSHVALGDLIIVGNVIANILLFVFLVLKLGYEGYAIYKVHKRTSKFSTVTYLQLLTVFLQQAGMGFEEIQIPAMNDDLHRTTYAGSSQVVPMKEMVFNPEDDALKLSAITDSKSFDSSNLNNLIDSKRETGMDANLFTKTDLELSKLNELMNELTKNTTSFVPKMKTKKTQIFPESKNGSPQYRLPPKPTQSPQKRLVPQSTLSPQRSKLQFNESEFSNFVLEESQQNHKREMKDSYWIPYAKDVDALGVTQNGETNRSEVLSTDRPLVEASARMKLRNIMQNKMKN